MERKLSISVLYFIVFFMKILEASQIPTSTNPFDILNARLSAIERLLYELKPPEQDRVETYDPTKKVYGIKGLAKFVGCSEPTAVKLARSGKFPRYQDRRKIFFYEADILKGMKRTSVNS